METKSCAICGEAKVISEFHRNSQSKDGFHSYCRTCRNDMVKAYAEAQKRRANPILIETKFCRRCGQTKLASEFYGNPRSKVEVPPYCKTCNNELHKANYYKTEKGRRFLDKYGSQYWDKDYYKYAERAIRLFHHSAKRTGLAFELTPDTLKQWWHSQPDECFYCGIGLDEYLILKNFILSYGGDNNEIAKFKKFFRNRFYKTSKWMAIDRMHNNQGYELKNIVKSCQICNSLKSDFFDIDQMRLIAPTILSRLKSEIENEKAKQVTPANR